MTQTTLDDLLRAADVTQVHVNGPGQVFAVRDGRAERTDVRFRDGEHLLEVLRPLLPPGERAALEPPGGEFTLPDGTRMGVVLGPAAPFGPVVTFRCRRPRAAPLRELLAARALTPEMALFLEAAVRAKLNVLLSCGNGADGLPLLEALSHFVHANDRLVVVTDAGKWPVPHPTVTWIEMPPSDPVVVPPVPRRHLFRQAVAAVNMRPGRVLVTSSDAGELHTVVRAATGGVSWITLIEAAGPQDAQFQVEVAATSGGTPTRLANVRKQLAGSLHLVAQIDRLAGGACKVTRIDEAVAVGPELLYHTLFRYRMTGVTAAGPAGRFEGTGINPTFLDRLRSHGLRLPVNLFRERTLAAD